MSAQPENLDDWRSRIDSLNAQLVELLNERARCAEGIAAFKQQNGLPVFDAKREQAVLDKVSALNKGPLADEALHRIFNCIMEEHRLLQETRHQEQSGQKNQKDGAA